MRKDKAWLKEEIWKQDIVMNKGYIYTDDLMSIINEVDEQEVTLDKAFEKIAESYLMTKEEIWRYLERLEARGGKVTYDEPKVLSHEWIYEHKKGVFMDNKGRKKDFVWVDDLQKLLVPKQDKPVIPQFAADFIEKWKNEGLTMSEWFEFNYDDQDEDKVSKWLYDNDYEENRTREHLLIDAIRYGYEVKKEKKYRVIVRRGEQIMLFLCKDEGNVVIGTNEYYIEKYPEATHLTEQEIKDYDKRYWAFAEPVQELEK